jgi:hypothetical protein
MNDVIIAIAIVYGMIQIPITVIFADMFVHHRLFDGNGDFTPILFPAEWHRISKLNWFGAAMASIGGFIFCPIAYLCRIFSWLCHVGRK